MGRLLFSEASPDMVEGIDVSEQVYLFPTMPDQYVFIKNLISARQYSITDILGRVLGEGIIQSGGQIPVYDLPPGIYYVLLGSGDRLKYAGSFYKTD